MRQQNRFLSVDQQVVGDCYTSREVMDTLVTLCDEFGSRFGGTEGEREAAEYLAAKMEESGLTDVHMEPVEYIGWIRGEVKLDLIGPIQKTIPCISLPHSPAADLEGTIVDMEDGAPEDFERRAEEIKGKIVMTTSVAAPRDQNAGSIGAKSTGAACWRERGGSSL